MAAGVRFEPATLGMQGTEPATEPPHSVKSIIQDHLFVPIPARWLASGTYDDYDYEDADTSKTYTQPSAVTLYYTYSWQVKMASTTP